MNRIIFIVVALMLPGAFALAGNVPADWAKEWPRTDFSTATVNFSEILSGGPPKDGIPAIDKPKFIPVADVANLAGTEPVIAFSLNGQTRAYPLRVMIWHEIVNEPGRGQRHRQAGR